MPESCTLYSEAPSAVARMHSPAGSTGHGNAPCVDALADGAAEPRAHVAEIPVFALIDVFGDAAGEHDAVDAAEIADRIGQIEVLDVVRHRPHCQRRDQSIGHHVGDFLHVGEIDRIAAIPGKAGALGVMFSRRIEPDDLAVLDDLQAAADMDGRGRDHLALLDQRELGGAAADVDVEDALVLVAGDARGAGAVGREHRFHVMAGGGGDEFAALLRKDRGDALRVLAPQRLAGENDDAGVDVVGMQIGGRRRRRR